MPTLLTDGGFRKLLIRMVEFVKNLFIASVSESDKMEFIISINSINIARVKITTITFIILEAMMLLFHY